MPVIYKINKTFQTEISSQIYNFNRHKHHILKKVTRNLPLKLILKNYCIIEFKRIVAHNASAAYLVTLIVATAVVWQQWRLAGHGSASIGRSVKKLDCTESLRSEVKIGTSQERGALCNSRLCLHGGGFSDGFSVPRVTSVFQNSVSVSYSCSSRVP